MRWRCVVKVSSSSAAALFGLVVLYATRYEVQPAAAVRRTVEEAAIERRALRSLQTVEEEEVFGAEVGEVTTGIVAGQVEGSEIRWKNTNITAMNCVQNAPVQVMQDAPFDKTHIRAVYFSFDSDSILGHFAIDAYDEATNPVVRRHGQPDRVNAAAMFVDSDHSNYPLAIFLFDSNELAVDDEEMSREIYLCRFDALRIECFEDSPLERVGRASTIPFAGFMLNSTYFYANGVGIADRGVSRPLFVVHDITSDSPDFNDNKPYYIQRTANRGLRCSDLTGFFADYVAAEEVPGGEPVAAAVSEARAFLTCITSNALGIVLISLSFNLEPQSYLWIEGVDLVVAEDRIYPPENDGSKTTPVRFDDGEQVGSFGACYELYSPKTRVFCTSNTGKGLWEIQLPVEVGYCNDRWQAVAFAPARVDAGRCQRWCPATTDTCLLLEEEETGQQALGGKPRVLFVAPQRATIRNDGLTCRVPETQGLVVSSSLADAVITAPPSPGPKFGADPVVVGSRGAKVQFWLPLGKWHQMLSTPDSIDFYVRCFGKPGTHAQWIDGIVIKERGVVTLDVIVRHQAAAAAAAAAKNGGEHSSSSSSSSSSSLEEEEEDVVSFLDVKVDGRPIFKIAAGYASNRGSAVVDLAKNDYPILDELGDAVSVATSAFQLEFFTMPARKYKDDYEAAKWTHIDFKFVSVKNRDKCTGFLSDLMFGTDTFDPELKASWLKKPPVLDTDDYEVEAPEVLAGLTDVVFS